MLTPYWTWKSTCISNNFLLPSYCNGENTSSLLKANSSDILFLSYFTFSKIVFLWLSIPCLYCITIFSHSTKSFVSCKTCSQLTKHKNDNDLPWAYQPDFCLFVCLLVFVCFVLLGGGVVCFSLTPYVYYSTLSHLAPASTLLKLLFSTSPDGFDVAMLIFILNFQQNLAPLITPPSWNM